MIQILFLTLCFTARQLLLTADNPLFKGAEKFNILYLNIVKLDGFSAVLNTAIVDYDIYKHYI